MEIDADEVFELHRLLMQTIGPPPARAAQFFELEGWHPHMTLRQGQVFDLADLRADVAHLGPLPAFNVDEIWVCRQDASGAAFPEEALSLL